MKRILKARVLVLSDLGAAGKREDRSGPVVRELLEARGWQVAGIDLLPDDEEQIREQLLAWRDSGECDAIFTSGGTGLAPRDRTPEATRAVIDREIPGLAEQMRARGTESTPRAALSRAVVGIAKATLIVNLPGSPRGARESLDAILDVLPHAIDQIQGRTVHPEL